MFSSGGYQYGYAPGNKRVWKAVCCDSSSNPIEEITFWSVTGQKLATYQLVSTPGQMVPTTIPPVLTANQTGTNYYFGSKLIKNASGYVGADRLGSSGKFYPYGQERPPATTNGTEKFTGYFRDSETGMDYADQRYHSPGTGRFMTADSSSRGINAKNPGTWNRYAYVLGDPINHSDPAGTDCATYASYDSSGNLASFQDWGCTFVAYVGPAYTGYGGNDFWSNTASQVANGLAGAQAAGAAIAASLTQSGPINVPGSWVAGMTGAVNALDSIETAKLSDPNCQKDLNKIGVSGSQLNSAAKNLWGPVDGTSSNSAVASVSSQTPDFSGETVSQLFAANPGVSALAGNLANVVYIDPGQWASYSPAQAFGTMLHELIHMVTGQSDQNLGRIVSEQRPLHGQLSYL